MAMGRLPRPVEAWVRIAAIVAALVLLVVSVALGATLYAGALIVLFVGVLAQVTALPLALVRPGLAAPLSIVGAVVVMFAAHADGGPWPWAVPTLITQALIFAALGQRAVWVLGAAAFVFAVAASGLAAALVMPGHEQQSVSVNIVVFASIGAVALVAGVVLRKWEAIRRQLARERRVTEEERERRLVAEEKTRIARELHDVIAHSMSLITVQATSAPFRHPQVNAEVRDEFADIAATSRRALTEMRSLLGVLRDSDAPVERTPQPRLSGIVELVTQSRHSGLTVTLHGGEALSDDAVDDAVGLSAYRIVQEALSNAIRHAPGAAVEVRALRNGGLDLTISNSGGAPTRARVRRTRARNGNSRSSGKGSGQRGMRERAASVGGSLSFGPTADGGYEVHVTLPLRAAEGGTG
ncbi:MAG TPA: histidine kinase [Pseudolysinimonas sp.]|nr:histidine kinase [Pseudolysinimonas sp.]